MFVHCSEWAKGSNAPVAQHLSLPHRFSQHVLACVPDHPDASFYSMVFWLFPSVCYVIHYLVTRTHPFALWFSGCSECLLSCHTYHLDCTNLWMDIGSMT